jgi:hypothetical protein
MPETRCTVMIAPVAASPVQSKVTVDDVADVTRALLTKV